MNQQSQYPTTFIQQPAPLPTQIYNQRSYQQQVVQQQIIQQQEQQQSYLYQIKQDQQRRMIEQQHQKKRSLEERPDFTEMQGGQPPVQSWMGDDVYMVAFLLSVEVERLRDENSSLITYFEQNEVKFRQMELIEGELQSARMKIGEYEKRIALLQNECEQWKIKYTNREKESEDARYQNELQRRVLIDREIRELTAKFISDRNQLELENKQLRNELDQLKLKRSSIDDVLIQAEAIEQENQHLKQELNKLRRGFDELDYVLQTAAELEEKNIKYQVEIEDLKERLKFHEQITQNQPQTILKPKQNIVQSQNLTNNNVQQYEKEIKLLKEDNQSMKQRLQMFGQNVKVPQQFY